MSRGVLLLVGVAAVAATLVVWAPWESEPNDAGGSVRDVEAPAAAVTLAGREAVEAPRFDDKDALWEHAEGLIQFWTDENQARLAALGRNNTALAEVLVAALKSK